MPNSGEEEQLLPRGRSSATTRRTAKQIIDQAIKENKVGESRWFIFAYILVAIGIIIIIYGMVQGAWCFSLVGTLTSGLFYPVMRETREIRRENIAIRLLESPLSMSQTEQEAAAALREFFVDTFIQRPANPRGRDDSTKTHDCIGYATTDRRP